MAVFINRIHTIIISTAHDQSFLLCSFCRCTYEFPQCTYDLELHCISPLILYSIMHVSQKYVDLL